MKVGACFIFNLLLELYSYTNLDDINWQVAVKLAK